MKKSLVTLMVTCIAAGAPVAGYAGSTAKPENVEAAPASADVMTIRVKVPLFSPLFAEFPVATVNDEPITVNDLNASLETVHEGMAEGTQAPRRNFTDILNRIITSKLIIQEGRNIGLDQQEQPKEMIDTFSRKLLREMVLKDHVKDMRPDPKEVEKRYGQLNVEWTFSTLIFKDEADAKKARKALDNGTSFDDLMAAEVKEKRAEAKQNEKLRYEHIHPDIVKIIDSLKPGSVGPVIDMQKGAMLFRLDAVKHSDDPRLKEKAEKEVLTAARFKALEKYRSDLIEKHLKQDKKLIKSLDFEKDKAAFTKFLEDKRPLATIKGEKPVTVADLAEAIRMKFYHGVDMAIDQKKVNKAKDSLLFEILATRAIEKEGRDKGFDKKKEYLDKVADYQDSVIFGHFVEKVIRPDVKVTEDELKAYYEAHKSEYSYPIMVVLDGIAFNDQNAAQSAAEKLRQGMDFKWFKENAEGHVDAKAAGVIQFEDVPVTLKTLPEGLNKVITGAQTGEYRVYSDPNGFNYVILVRNVIPEQVQPFPEVEAAIRKNVQSEQLNKLIVEWADKLRKASDVKIFAEF
ncbi:peptidyl-prolyl cis-trans isomerase [Geobacter anodireducens]